MMANVIILIISAATFKLAFGSGDFDYTCFPGITPSAGVITPKGDIDVEVGSSPFPIYCHLNPEHRYYNKSGRNANDLEFRVVSGDEDTIEYTLKGTVLNDTTIRVVYDPKTMTTDRVSCVINLDGKEDKRGICYQYINVGVKPLPPEDFSCISKNWQNLNCTWKEPYNPAKTKYALSYIQPGRFGHICLANFDSNCEIKTESPIGSVCQNVLVTGRVHNSGSMVSAFFAKMDKFYSKQQKLLHFRMCRTNHLDHNMTQWHDYTINYHTDLVQPDPANNITLVPFELRKLRLQYKIPYHLDHFPPGLRHRIRIRSRLDPDWKEVNTRSLDRHQSQIDLKLENLFPYIQYEVEISLQSAEADPENMKLWSEPATIKGITEPEIPSEPPKTALGSFEIVGGLQKRRIYVYWQQIGETMRNGPDLKYVVTEVLEDGRVKPINPVNVTNAYAEFRDMSLKRYSFEITSSNRLGYAAGGTSRINVPHHDELRGLQPRSFTRIAYSETLFEVSWIPPVKKEKVESYTVFWCKTEDNRDRPYQCSGYLDWREFPAHQHMANISLPSNDIYQFAVAANTKQISSGMIWATCIILHNRVVGKLKTVSIENVEPTSMEVKWRLDCSDRVGIVTGYKITYCPIKDDSDTSECIDKKEYSRVTQPATESTILDDLTPWTFYKVGVAVLTRAGESEMSEYLVNRTEKGRPGSPPTHIDAKLINRNEVFLKWEPPVMPNAPIHFYEIRKTYKDFLGHPRSSIVQTSDLEIKLGNLLFNQEYKFGLRACTEIVDLDVPVCGEKWAEKTVVTRIGKSGKMPSPLVRFKNSTELTVEWDTKYEKGGPVDHFDLNITHERFHRSHIIQVNGIQNQIDINLEEIVDEMNWSPDCTNKSITNFYNFSIRAITFDPETLEMFNGDWSADEVQQAYCSKSIPWAIILGIVIPIPIIGMIAVLYFYKCCGLCVKAGSHWKEVEVDTNLSQGDRDLKKANHSVHHIRASKKPVYQRAPSKESSETLLPRENKRNISGCSETSSATSGSASCGSTRSSELEEQDPSEVIQTDVPSQHPEQSYVTASNTKNPSGYSQVGTSGWQPRPLSPPSGLDHQPHQTILPPGYSRVGVSGDVSQDTFHLQSKPVCPGYIAFEHAQNPPPPAPGITSQPGESKGYITFAQANKMETPQTSMTLSSFEDDALTTQSNPIPPGAYSRVGLCSSGYVPPEFLNQTEGGLDRRPNLPSGSLNLSLKSNNSEYPGIARPIASPTSPGYSQVSSMSDNYQGLKSKGLPEVAQSLSSTQGYVSPPKLHFSNQHSIEDPTVLMSPKNLKVESRSPYSKPVTSVQEAKSTMV